MKPKQKKFSHIDVGGEVTMVDVSRKPSVQRSARAEGKIFLASGTIALLRKKALPKGDALATARIAGILAAKKTSEIIPLCHPVALTSVDVDFEIEKNGIRIESRTACVDKTGIEMEALTAVAAAALTLYDMCKAVDKTMRIGEIRLLEKKKEAFIL
ncbi:MAG: cyclic pyranopterin monophosphate synthase MoaC [Spirochaetia bacterium]|nr:cyclic pyranopterin monophosphate synthase MoaC [Spirochaetia bacterium]